MPKKATRRRWYLDAQGIRRAGSKEKGFNYVSSEGSAIVNRKTIERISRLGIPPAWSEVRIAKGEAAPLQAIGLDKKGRTQYIYHARFRQQQEDAKFQRLVEFAEALPKLRKHVIDDLANADLGKDQVLAAIVRLIDQGFFRVGNDESARSEQTYGLTTVLKKHVRVSGSTLQFDYIGKWRKTQSRAITDAQVAKLVRQLRKLPGDELFQFKQGDRVVDVKDRHVNEYIQRVIGDRFTAKDFRTWAGTLLCGIALAEQEPPISERDKKKKLRIAVEATAAMLGNTPAVCRSSYICPRLVQDYINDKSFTPLKRPQVGSPVAKQRHSIQERALIKLLRETIADRRSTIRAA